MPLLLNQYGEAKLYCINHDVHSPLAESTMIGHSDPPTFVAVKIYECTVCGYIELYAWSAIHDPKPVDSTSSV